MEELFAISQSSILLPQAPRRGRYFPVRFDRAPSAASSVRFLRTRSEPAVFFPTISAQALQQKRFSWGIRSGDSEVPSTLTVESASDEIEIQPDSSGGGNEFGGVSGGGGGGGGGNNWGNNNNEGEGGSDESEDTSKKKMAMSMSQKLTLGYAALIGVGGVMGYMKSGSQKSLMAGGLSALLLYFVYSELPTRPVFASSLGLGLSAALLGVMGSRFKKSGKIFPAGVVSFVSLVMSGGYLHGILRSLH